MKDETNVSNISLVGVCPFGYVMRGGVRGDCIFSPDECKWNQASWESYTCMNYVTFITYTTFANIYNI